MRYPGILVVAMALPSAAVADGPDNTAGPVPIRLFPDQFYSGGVTALGYFTPAEEADPAWEQQRRAFVLVGVGAPVRIDRRDVAWFGTGQPGDPRCARIVYTMTSRDEPQSVVAAHRDEVTRMTALSFEPHAPMEPGCGIKDRTRWPPPPPPEKGGYDRALEERAAAMRVEGSHCDGIERDPATPIRIVPGTKLWARTWIDAALSQAQWTMIAEDLDRRPLAVIESRSWLAFRPDPPAIEFGMLANDGRNILVTQRFARSRNGEGYCVELTARQGDRVWSRFVDRPVTVPERSDMVRPGGLSRDPDHYWTPATDAQMLSEMLATALGIPPRPAAAD